MLSIEQTICEENEKCIDQKKLAIEEFQKKGKGIYDQMDSEEREEYGEDVFILELSNLVFELYKEELVEASSEKR